MAKIIPLQEVERIVRVLHQQKKTVVVVGGCFDILHVGHIRFLSEAKKTGDVLLLLLESDANVTKLKGKRRPFFMQYERAEVLEGLSSVDYVILLPIMQSDEDYQKIITRIKPHVIAISENDPFVKKKEKQAKQVKGKIKVIPFIKTLSSSTLAKLLGID